MVPENVHHVYTTTKSSDPKAESFTELSQQRYSVFAINPRRSRWQALFNSRIPEIDIKFSIHTR
jgi:hypothetical protein